MRRTPYTETGVRRLKCWRVGCRNHAEHQWQACADHRAYRPICTECDVRLNDMVLKFMGDPQRRQKISAYMKRMVQT